MEVEARVWVLHDLHVLVLDLLAEPCHVRGHVVGHVHLPLDLSFAFGQHAPERDERTRHEA